MKRFIIVLILILFFSCFELSSNSEAFSNDKKHNTISYEDYLDENGAMDKVRLNKEGNVVYKGKFVLSSQGSPINVNTAMTTIELKIFFAAKGIKPRKNCNSKNIKQNGSLGCYIDVEK